MKIQVRDVMTRNVISVGSAQSVLHAAQLMLENRISGLPVVDGNDKLIGIVTEGDFLRRGEIGTQRQRPRWLEFLLGPGRLAEEYVQSSGRSIDEVMTADPYTVTEDESLESAVEVMERRRVKRLPVLRDGRLVGIVSRADLMHALAERARCARDPAPDDGTIRERLLGALADTHWAPRVDVKVHDGVAELSGVITDERERRALIVMAENVAGVKHVHDHLVWVEPISGTAFASPEDEAVAQTEDPARSAAH